MIKDEETKAKLLNDILEKANNNSDKQCYITPSKYGIARTSEATDNFIEMLLKFDIIKSVKKETRDLIIVTLYD